MSKFDLLPTDLQDIIMLFAYKTKTNIVKSNVEVLCLIGKVKLPQFFFKFYVRDPESFLYILSPLKEYTPFFDYVSLFHTYRIKELLYCLDFRRSCVRSLGTRWEWFSAIDENYESIIKFGLYYKMLIATGTNIWTPTYNAEREQGSARF